MSERKEPGKWRVRKSFDIYEMDDTRTLHRRRCWEVQCPKDHVVRMTTNFDDFLGNPVVDYSRLQPFELPCPICTEPVLYLISFKEDCEADA